MLTGAVATSITKGVQAHDGCYVTVKHFAANNQEHLRNRSDSVVSERALREIYLRAFATTIRDGGAKAVMTSYNLLNGVRTVESPDLNTTALRSEWGFTGTVMSDWLATGKGQGSNGGAIQSGNDLIMPGGKWYRKALEADISAGIVTQEAIDAACINILELIATSRAQAEFEARPSPEVTGA
jgi:beta-glucosidase